MASTRPWARLLPSESLGLIVPKTLNQQVCSAKVSDNQDSWMVCKNRSAVTLSMFKFCNAGHKILCQKLLLLMGFKLTAKKRAIQSLPGFAAPQSLCSSVRTYCRVHHCSEIILVSRLSSCMVQIAGQEAGQVVQHFVPLQRSQVVLQVSF